MIVKDGEKFACDACIRGHRVSSCTHKGMIDQFEGRRLYLESVADKSTDRKLNHVNKKGRPVSQCQHCRGLRKVRASHVKCDCGEQGSKNITLEDEASAGMSCDESFLIYSDSPIRRGKLSLHGWHEMHMCPQERAVRR
jgi:hypothetical protein